MFYSVDILNPRNGKFGLIWLAAHGRLSTEEGLTKKKKTELRKILQVNLNQSCKEILNYLRGAVPADAPGADRPRLSLYLSAMLTYGVAYVFNQQVKTLLDEILSPRLVQCPPFQPTGNINCKVKSKPEQLMLKDATAVLDDNQPGFGQVGDGSTLDASGPRGPGFQVTEKSDGSCNISAQLTGEALIDWLLSDNTLPELGEIVFPVENTVAEAMITLKEVEPVLPVTNFEEGFGDIFAFQEFGDIPVALPLPEQQDPTLEQDGQPLGETNFDVKADAPTEGNEAGLRRSHSPDLESRKRSKHDEESEPTEVPAAILPMEPEPMDTAAPQDIQEAVPAGPAVSIVEEPTRLGKAEGEPVAPAPSEMELEPLNQEELPVPKKRGAKKKSRLIVDKRIVHASEILADWRSNYQSTMRVLSHSDDYAMNLYEGTAEFLMSHPGRKLRSRQLSRLFTRSLVVVPQSNEAFDGTGFHETQGMPAEVPAEDMPVPAIQVEIPEADGAFPRDKAEQTVAVEEAPVPVLEVQNPPDEPAALEELPTGGLLDVTDLLQTSVSRKRASSVAGSITSVSNTPRVSDVSGVPPASRLLPSATLEVLKEVSAELRLSAATSTKGTSPQINFAPLAIPAEIPEEPSVPPQMENIEVDNPTDAPVASDVSKERGAAASSPRDKRTPVPAGDELLAMIRLFFLENGLDSQDRITFKQLVPPARYIRVEAAKFFVNLLDLMKKGFIKLEQPSPEGDIFILLVRP